MYRKEKITNKYLYMDVSILIVNYNTKQLLKECLISIYQHTKEISFEIILIDNASTDGSQVMIKKYFPQVNFIESKKNLGFGRANNLGINIAKGEYLFFLNPDTCLIMNSIKMFFNFALKYKHKNIGCIGGWLNENNRLIAPILDFPTMKAVVQNIVNYYFKALFKTNLTDLNLKIRNKEDEYFDVDYICGADMFIPSNILQKVGNFDEQFFMYYEETDLQKRMQKQNLRRIVVNQSIILHKSGASWGGKKTKSNKRRIIDTESMFKYFYKHNSYIKVFCFRIIYFLIILPTFLTFKYSLKENILFLHTLIKNYSK